MTLYYQRSDKLREVVGRPKNEGDCMDMIWNFCAERGLAEPWCKNTWTSPVLEKYYDVWDSSEYFVRTIW